MKVRKYIYNKMNRNFFLSRIEVRKVNLICNNQNFFYNIKIFILFFCEEIKYWYMYFIIKFFGMLS